MVGSVIIHPQNKKQLEILEAFSKTVKMLFEKLKKKLFVILSVISAAEHYGDK